MSAERSLVSIVDDDEAVRAAMDSLFRSVGHLVETFASTEDYLAAKHSALPGCLVLDVRLPGASGLELQSILSARGGDRPIVFVTGHGDIPMTVAAMKRGAIEFLTKPFRDQELIDAVSRGVSMDRERRLRFAELIDLHQRFARLSAREREVMSNVTAGRMNKETAGLLDLSEVTVKVHRGNVMRKMEARSLADLVRMADRLSEN